MMLTISIIVAVVLFIALLLLFFMSYVKIHVCTDFKPSSCCPLVANTVLWALIYLLAYSTSYLWCLLRNISYKGKWYSLPQYLPFLNCSMGYPVLSRNIMMLALYFHLSYMVIEVFFGSIIVVLFYGSFKWCLFSI